MNTADDIFYGGSVVSGTEIERGNHKRNSLPKVDPFLRIPVADFLSESDQERQYLQAKIEAFYSFRIESVAFGREGLCIDDVTFFRKTMEIYKDGIIDCSLSKAQGGVFLPPDDFHIEDGEVEDSPEDFPGYHYERLTEEEGLEYLLGPRFFSSCDYYLFNNFEQMEKDRVNQYAAVFFVSVSRQDY